ncbi:MAG: oxidoreductase C-terminal domain-containing protein, partial [Streptosporangiaceae bacterium]
VTPGGYGKVVFRGDVAQREFIAFWLGADGRVLAGMNVNIWDATEAIQALVRLARPVDPAALGDPAAPLESLLG